MRPGIKTGGVLLAAVAAGAALAIRHLMELGHNHIVFCTGDDRNSWTQERLAGASEAMAEAGLPPENLILYKWGSAGWPTPEAVMDLAKLIRSSSPRLTAAFVCDEATALPLVEGLPHCGMQVPQISALP